MATCAPPCAKKLVDLTLDKKIITHRDALNEILLQPDVKDKPVCVVSITGTFRQGKSFLLNFLLRYLSLKYKGKRSAGKKWLNTAEGKISGFEWKCGKERHTIGILMWSEVFLAQLPTGREVAIVLLDTQGTFDNKTTKQQCAGIFAISTLISSVQIFNLKGQISQSDLEYLECFSGYGRMATDRNSSEPPFQNLCFLIRDWQYSYQNNFGPSDEYLDEFLNSDEQPEELRSQNENIKALFKKMSCFLLPHPGENVATQPTFRGEFKDINPEFLKYVEQFALKILAPENLVPKLVNGTEIRTKDLVDYVHTYCQFFMSEDTPQLESMFLATAYAQMNVVLKEALEVYISRMNSIVNEKSETMEEYDLVYENERCKREAIQYVQKKKILGEEELKATFVIQFEKMLDEKFADYCKINDIKLERKRQLDEMKDEVKNTEERMKDEIKCQKKEYDKLLENQKAQLHASEKRQEELEGKVDELENQIVVASQTPEDPLDQMIHGLSKTAHGAVDAATGFARMTFGKLKFW